MGVRGTLTRANIGFSMPPQAALFPRPPYHYPGATLLVYKYVTDAASAASVLPAQAELTDPPIAGLVFANYPVCTLEPYVEAVQFLACMYQGKLVQYATQLFVTSDIAMAAGREMGGYPKKMAAISLQGDPVAGYNASLERPAGQPLVTATLNGFGPPKPVATADSTLHYLCLRLIPSATKDAPPTVCELLLSDWQIVKGQVYEGSGSCSILGTSALDPLHLAPIVSIVSRELILADLLVTANDPDPLRSQPF